MIACYHKPQSLTSPAAFCCPAISLMWSSTAAVGHGKDIDLSFRNDVPSSSAVSRISEYVCGLSHSRANPVLHVISASFGRRVLFSYSLRYRPGVVLCDSADQFITAGKRDRKD